MIICVSANPAIDRRLRINNLQIGAVNRAVSVEAVAGGKAAHVAMAARENSSRRRPHKRADAHELRNY